jgi:LysM repeat protein
MLYTIAPILPAPTFSLAAGTYTTSQSVTISDATAGTAIYYTTNGTTPTTSSTKYTGAITVSATETLEAIAVESGYTNSPVATAAYFINTTLPAPTFSLAAGTYTTSQSVTISDATAGATIYYTTNGSTPTTSSAVYSGPITVSATETLEAIAVESGYTNSPIATAAYFINATLPAPTFSLAAGTYTTSQSVTISDATAGTTIYYTTNGTTPTTSSTKYTGAITVSATETLEAIAVESGYSNSPVATAAYSIASVVSAPTFSPAPGTYTSQQSVTINDATAGTTIYYTTNGSTPTTSSTKYMGAITVSATETLEAIAVESGYTNSPVATAAYSIASVVSAPTFSPAPGTYTSPQSVTISDTTAGATIYYTTNGNTPTTSSTQYMGAIWQSSTQTLKAIAVEAGYTNSSVTTAAYIIAPVLPAPTFSPTGGGASWALFTTPPSVTISDTTAGTTIYYTTNGNTPTTSSTKYTGTITVSTTETLEAIAVESGYTNSPASSMLYTIAPILPAPTFSLAAGTYTTSQSVTISDATAGTAIYYTTNGSTPTTSSTKYTGAITVSATETLEAIAVESGYSNSPVATAAYFISGNAQASAVSDFTISASSTSASVTPGSSAVFALTVTPLSPATTFTTVVNLMASGLPAGATYSFSPATIAEGAGTTAVTFTVQLPQTISDMKPPGPIDGKLTSGMAPLALGLLLLPFAGKLRNAGKRLGRVNSALVPLAAAIAVMTMLSGCGSTFNIAGSNHQTQTYTVNVIGTTAVLSESTSLTLNVEQ